MDFVSPQGMQTYLAPRIGERWANRCVAIVVAAIIVVSVGVIVGAIWRVGSIVKSVLWPMAQGVGPSINGRDIISFGLSLVLILCAVWWLHRKIARLDKAQKELREAHEAVNAFQNQIAEWLREPLQARLEKLENHAASVHTVEQYVKAIEMDVDEIRKHTSMPIQSVGVNRYGAIADLVRAHLRSIGSVGQIKDPDPKP